MEITPFILARDVNAAERKITTRPAAGAAEDQPHGGLQHLCDVVAAAADHADGHQRQILCPELPTDLPYEQIATAHPRPTELLLPSAIFPTITPRTSASGTRRTTATS